MLAVTAIGSKAMSQVPTSLPAIGQAPTDADPNRMAEDALEQLEKGTKEGREKAAEIIDKLRMIAPRLPKLHLACAKLLAADGKGPAAIRYYEFYKNTTDGKNDWQVYADMGRMYMRSKRPRTARRYLEDARKMAPEKDLKNRFVRAEVAMDLATVLHQLEDNTEAVSVAREAATQASSDARIQILYCKLLLAVTPSETKEVRQVAAGAIAKLLEDLDPFSIPNLQMLRDALAIVETTWATETQLQDKNPEPAHFLSMATQDVAEINRRIGLVAAKEYEERAIELNKSKVEYKIRLAEIEAQLGATRNANEILDEVLKDEPKNAEAIALKERIASTPVRKIGVAAGL